MKARQFLIAAMLVVAGCEAKVHIKSETIEPPNLACWINRGEKKQVVYSRPCDLNFINDAVQIGDEFMFVGGVYRFEGRSK